MARYDDRRFRLGSGLFGLVHGLRRQFPLLDRGRSALMELHERLGAGCSMSKIGGRHLITVNTVGHPIDGEHAVAHWLQRVTPRLTQTDIEGHRRVLGDIRDRGYGAWRFDDAQSSLHDRLVGVLASLEPTASGTRQLSTLMTMVT